MSVREFLILLMICTLWGVHFSVIKVTVGVIAEPFFYAGSRMAILAILLSPWLRWHGAQMKYVLLGGLGFGALNYAFLFPALELTTAAAASVTIELYAPFSIILSVIFLKERIGIWRSLGVALAFIGVVVIGSSAPSEVAGPYYVAGIILMACAALAEAMGAVSVKSVKDIGPVRLLAWFSLVGACILIPLSLIFEDNQLSAFQGETRLQFIGALVYSAFLASLLAHGAYYWLLQRLPMHTVAPSGLLTTVIGVSAAAFLLGEPLGARFFLGAGITLSGVGLILWRNRQRDATTITETS